MKKLEASIPPIEKMKTSFRNYIKTKPPGTSLLFVDGKMAGFCTVIKDEDDPTAGEVHMIGVDPQSRTFLAVR